MFNPLLRLRLGKIQPCRAILPRPAASEQSETEPPENSALCAPRFLDRAFQLRYRSLKACRTCRTCRDKKLEFVRICTDLYGFVRKVIIKSRVCFLRTHPYPSVPIRIPRKNTGIKRANTTLKSPILKSPIQKRCYAPIIRSIRKGSGRVGLAYWMAGSPKSIAASIRYPRGSANFFLRDGISRNA